MKKIISFFLIVIFALSLCACSVKDKVQDAVKDALPGTQGAGDNASPGTPTQGAASAGDPSDGDGDITQEDWDNFQDWAHAQGWDGEGYHFPQVDSMREWPSASFWAELGLPDMTPDVMENGEIYNDGNVHIDGYSDAFVAECDTDEASFYALAQKLWDAGVRGVNPGNGHIVPVDDIEWLIDDDPNYLWYRAYYEHEGGVMEVYLQKMNGWGDSLWVGVIYAPSDPNFEQKPRMDWPASEIKTLTGFDLPNPGGDVYGAIDMDEYRCVELVIEGVSQADYERYLQNLRSGSLPIIEDDYGGGDFYGVYGYSFYPEDYEAHPAFIEVNYASGVLFISVNEI